jgi:solute carrier family 6 amino acid/orphan transporter-like 15/16/17/18/20
MEDGIAYLFTPKWEKLMDPVVWLEAGTQIFFSLGLAFGGLIAYSSYNPANNNVTKDAIFVAFTNCSTSLFAGIVIFAIMGFKAHKSYEACLETRNNTLMLAFNSVDLENIQIPENGEITYNHPETGLSITTILRNCSLQNELDNSASGTGLAFILFTEAVNQFPFANLWAVLFFLMLLSLGLDSQFGTLQGVVQCFVDLKLFPNLRKEIMTGVLCGICFLISLCFSHGGGNYIFTLFDNFSGSIPLLIIALFEVIGVSYFYGIRTLARDIELMTGSKPGLYWMICWKYISPFVMTIILLASFIQIIVNGAGYDAWVSELGETKVMPWPWWAKIMIVFLIGISVLWIPIVALLRLFNVSFLTEEGPGWFPEPELKEFYSLGEYTDSKWEEKLLGHKKDGKEGIIFSTIPPYVKANAKSKEEDGMEDEDEPINIIAASTTNENLA